MNDKIKGWIVSMLIDTSQLNSDSNPRDELSHLSWSPYDRITIDEVEKFSDFFTKESFTWYGAVQRLHLVPMSASNWIPGKDCLIDTQSSSQKEQGIYCIVTARFKKLFKNVKSVEYMLCDTVSEYLKDRKIQWQAFQSLGSEDFVGIFLAEDIANLAEVCEFLKQLTYTDSDNTDGVNNALFSSVYSFLGLNYPNYCHEPNADLIERLYLKPGYTRQIVRSELEKVIKNIFPRISYHDSISGRGCLEVEIPNDSNIFKCFNNEEIAVFNGESDFYNTYIENSRTYWYVDITNTEAANIGIVSIQKQGNSIDIDDKEFKMHPISKFILKEYERLINSQRCLLWRAILIKQYEVYVEYVKQYTREENLTELCSLNNKVQTVLLHINQATTPIYEVPYHNYYYSGSYNDVLRMYYGVIAAIFNLGFKLPRSDNTHQYNITYCVDFEAATKVHSTMYVMHNSNTRFVIFHLPYDAFMHFDKAIKFLLHEVFHYIAPYNRTRRNNVFVKNWIINVFEQYIRYLQYEGLSEKDSKNICKYFYCHYEQYCRDVNKEIGDVLDERILNDFTDQTKLNKLKPILEAICKILCDDICENCGVWISKVKDYCSYENVYQILIGSTADKSFPGVKYFNENMRRMALATKEAFCDINMIKILDMELEEYATFLCDAFCRNYIYDTSDSVGTNNILRLLKVLLQSEYISIGSVELRIGMVLDQFFWKELKDTDPNKYRDALCNEVDNNFKNKRDDTIFRLFCEYLKRVYTQYLNTFRREHSIFRELFNNEDVRFKKYSECSEIQEKLRNAASKQDNMHDNVSVMRDFMLEDIDNTLLDNKGGVQDRLNYYNIDCNPNWETDTLMICNIGEYVKACCQIIQDWGDSTVWFRGVCSHEFKLLPSLLRYNKLDPKLSLYANQANLLKEAYYVTISRANLWTEQMNGKLEHLCLLQHYGIPTNLLDFTEDMLMALHFALNPDNKNDAKKVDKYEYQPKVVIFNPLKYREAIESLKEGTPKKLSTTTSPYILYMQNEQLEEFYVDNMSDRFLNDHSRDNTVPYIPNSRINPYPEPLAVPRSNERIYAQKGTFVAFNLSAHPEIAVGKQPYMYLSLENIQKEYLAMLKNEGLPEEAGRFLKEIYIDKMSISNIKSELKTMNITTARAYPELFRVFKIMIESK